MLSRVVRGSERPRGRLMSVGMDWTYLREYRTMDDDLHAYGAVTLGDVAACLERYPLTRVSAVALGPLGRLEMPA